jgi:hypothetical protein
MKKFLIFLFISLIVFSLGFPFVISAMAVSGWAWSSNIGWISFNRLNCDPDGDGFSGPPPIPVACPPVGTAIPAYGVTLEPTVAGTRNLTGFAWSSHVGWIHFDPAGPFPAAPAHSARVDSPHLATSTVSGWARVCAVFETGCGGPLHPQRGHWDGWIKMRGTTTAGTPYGVTVDFTTNKFSGWAWSNMVVGWISFRDLGYGVTIVNVPPIVKNPSHAINHCIGHQPWRFSWTFYDPGDRQDFFRLQVATNTAFAPTTTDSGIISSIIKHGSVGSYAPLNPSFTWNTTYFWRVMVWDRHGATSTWSTTTSFKTPVHRPPHVRFSWSPIRPIVGEVVTFTDKSVCFGPAAGGTATATCAFRAWDFNNDGITDSTTTPATTTFAIRGRHPIRLRVIDPLDPGHPNSALYCTITQHISVDARPPEWIEIPPVSWLRKFWASIMDVLQRIRV